MQIWKYTNAHVEKYRCEKCKRVCKESKYILMLDLQIWKNTNGNILHHFLNRFIIFDKNFLVLLDHFC